MNEARPAVHDRIALLIFWAVPGFIGRDTPRATASPSVTLALKKIG
jgi:hypothetical protein